MYKFSLILPVYNVEKFIGDCLDSLLDQDISRQEYEIICVNDGSSDQSSQEIKKYMACYSNIKLIEQENTGVCAARNRGLEHAAGEYVWFIDPDDMIVSKCLGKIYKYMKQEGADIFEFEYKICAENDRFESKSVVFEIDGFNKLDASGSGWQYVCSLAYLKQNQIIWNEKLSYGEDYLWAFQVKYRNHKSLYTNVALYVYRQRQGSAMHSVDSEKIKKHMNDMAILYTIYEEEHKRCDNENLGEGILKNIRQRQQLCAESVLYNLLKLKYDSRTLNQELRVLKKKGIYPYKYLVWNLMGKKVVNPLKFRIFTFLFPFEPYYKIVYKIYRRIGRS